MTTEERFEKLEQKLARARIINRLFILFGIGVLLVMWFFATQGKVIDEVRAKQFTLVDENGNPWASMGGKYGQSLFFNDKNGNLRIWLSTHGTGPVVLMFDENKHPRVDLRVDKDGQPSLSMLDNNYSVIWKATQ